MPLNKETERNETNEDMEQSFNQMDPDKRKKPRKLEKIQLKIINSAPSSLIKLALIRTCCLNIHASIYIYIYTHIFSVIHRLTVSLYHNSSMWLET